MIEINNSHFDFVEISHGSREQISRPNYVQTLPSVTPYSQYTMQEIIPGVFLGPYAAAMQTKLNNLMTNGITHIICIREELEAHLIQANFINKFKYLILEIADTANENIIRYFTKVRQFIEECLTLGGKVLIHGYRGISRSAALVLAYVMQKFGLTCREAYALVKSRRYCIEPNANFLNQLIEFEPIYRAQQTLDHGQSSTTNNNKKRKADQLEINNTMLPLPPPPSPVTDFDTDMSVT